MHVRPLASLARQAAMHAVGRACAASDFRVCDTLGPLYAPVRAGPTSEATMPIGRTEGKGACSRLCLSHGCT